MSHLFLHGQKPNISMLLVFFCILSRLLCHQMMTTALNQPGLNRVWPWFLFCRTGSAAGAVKWLRKHQQHEIHCVSSLAMKDQLSEGTNQRELWKCGRILEKFWWNPIYSPNNSIRVALLKNVIFRKPVAKGTLAIQSSFIFPWFDDVCSTLHSPRFLPVTVDGFCTFLCFPLTSVLLSWLPPAEPSPRTMISPLPRGVIPPRARCPSSSLECLRSQAAIYYVLNVFCCSPELWITAVMGPCAAPSHFLFSGPSQVLLSHRLGAFWNDTVELSGIIKVDLLSLTGRKATNHTVSKV